MSVDTDLSPLHHLELRSTGCAFLQKFNASMEGQESSTKE